ADHAVRGHARSRRRRRDSRLVGRHQRRGRRDAEAIGRDARAGSPTRDPRRRARGADRRPAGPDRGTLTYAAAVNAPPAPAWRAIVVRGALAAVPLWVTIAVLVLNTPWRTKLLVGAVFGLTIASPANGLIATAMLAPFGHLTSAVLRLDPFRVSES